MTVLGIDTSCYTTSVAAADENGVITSCRKLLPVQTGARGLRQSEAVFVHMKQLPALYEEAMQALNGRTIDATQGRKTKSVIVMENDRIVLSALLPETIRGRALADPDADQEEE